MAAIAAVVTAGVFVVSCSNGSTSAGVGSSTKATVSRHPGMGALLWLAYHLVLVSLLVAATAIDFDCYIIPDPLTIPGILVGIGGAFAVGDLQLCHSWVDWSVAVPQLTAYSRLV